MSPALGRGDLVVDAPVTTTTTYQVGDIITFHPTPGYTTTHRIVAVDAAGISTRGDANATADLGQITARHDRGTRRRGGAVRRISRRVLPTTGGDRGARAGDRRALPRLGVRARPEAGRVEQVLRPAAARARLGRRRAGVTRKSLAGLVAVLAAVASTTSLLAFSVAGTGAYFTDSHAGSISGSVLAAPTPPTPDGMPRDDLQPGHRRHAGRRHVRRATAARSSSGWAATTRSTAATARTASSAAMATTSWSAATARTCCSGKRATTHSAGAVTTTARGGQRQGPS